MVKKNPRRSGGQGTVGLGVGRPASPPLGSPPERPEVLAERRRRPRPTLAMCAYGFKPVNRIELGEVPGMTLSGLVP